MITIEHLRSKFRGLGCAQLFDAGQGRCWKLDVDLCFRGNGQSFCGPVIPVSTQNDMLPCLTGLKEVGPGWVLLVQNTAKPSLALLGDIFARAAELQGAAGVFLDGAVRDIAFLRTSPLPVCATSVNVIPAKASSPGATPAAQPSFRAIRRALDGTLVSESVGVSKGDWIFVDGDGALLVRAADVRMVVRAAQILDHRERRLRDAIAPERPLAKLIGLDGYVEGEGPLRSRA